MTTAELENENCDINNNNNSHSLSETTRKVFFPNNNNIIKLPSRFFSPTVVITAKGLHPPSIILLPTLKTPTRSLSLPIRLITMAPTVIQESVKVAVVKQLNNNQENQQVTPSLTHLNPPSQPPLVVVVVQSQEIIMKKTQSTPIPKPSKSTSTNTNSRLKKPTLIDKLISTISNKTNSTKSSTTTVRKAPRPSTSTLTASAAPVQIKTSNSIKLTHTKKKSPPPTPPNEEEEEEDIPITKPISLTEKRKRQAKRADQVKIWKVREEREAREARSIIRKKMMSGIISKKSTSNEASPAGLIRKKKKRVKFDFDKNSIIQLPLLEE